MKALILIAPILVPGVVWADGWVLWKQLDNSWFIRDAFEQRTDCMKAMESDRGFYDLTVERDQNKTPEQEGTLRTEL